MNSGFTEAKHQISRLDRSRAANEPEPKTTALAIGDESQHHRTRSSAHL
jgi:hypothetical protein